MLYAIVSDIHANRQAWQAVRDDIRSHGVEEILCLGDMVDYGPDPAEVLRSVYAHCKHIVTGNHDAALCGRLDPASFNPKARQALDWTRERLDGKALEVLKGLPSMLQGAGFRCAHASPLSPSQYDYLLSPEDVQPTWDSFPEPICFVGHSHVPAIFVRRNQGLTRFVSPQDFEMEEGKRYLVNVGSVGQPRDGGILACYCLFDSVSRTVFFRRVAFDIEAFRRELLSTAIPEGINGFVSIADGLQLPPVRELIDFSPLATGGERSTVKNVAVLERRLKRWRVIGVLALLISVGLSLLIAAVATREPSEAGVLYPRLSPVEFIDSPTRDAELLPAPQAIGAIDEANRLQWYQIRVSDPHRQAVFVEHERLRDGGVGEVVFRVAAQEPLPFSIESVAVVAPANSRFRAQMQFKSPAVREGFVELLILEHLATGGTRLLARNAPNILERDERWYPQPQCTTPIDQPLRGGEKLSLVIRGEMAGEILLRKIQFTRCQ